MAEKECLWALLRPYFYVITCARDGGGQSKGKQVEWLFVTLLLSRGELIWIENDDMRGREQECCKEVDCCVSWAFTTVSTLLYNTNCD